jgi:hypothetical protein
MSIQQNTGTSGLIDEKAIDNGDPVFTKEQLKRFNYQLKRNLAAESQTDAINGKSPMLVVETYFRCQYSLGEFER